MTQKGMDFKDIKIDPNVWWHKSTKPNRTPYYELLLVYVEDILLVSHDPKPMLKAIGEEYELKVASLKEPDTYLGVQISKWGLPDGMHTWAMSSKKYVKNTVLMVETLLARDC